METSLSEEEKEKIRKFGEHVEEDLRELYEELKKEIRQLRMRDEDKRFWLDRDGVIYDPIEFGEEIGMRTNRINMETLVPVVLDKGMEEKDADRIVWEFLNKVWVNAPTPLDDNSPEWKKEVTKELLNRLAKIMNEDYSGGLKKAMWYRVVRPLLHTLYSPSTNLYDSPVYISLVSFVLKKREPTPNFQLENMRKMVELIDMATGGDEGASRSDVYTGLVEWCTKIWGDRTMEGEINKMEQKVSEKSSKRWELTQRWKDVMEKVREKEGESIMGRTRDELIKVAVLIEHAPADFRIALARYGWAVVEVNKSSELIGKTHVEVNIDDDERFASIKEGYRAKEGYGANSGYGDVIGWFGLAVLSRANKVVFVVPKKVVEVLKNWDGKDKEKLERMLRDKMDRYMVNAREIAFNRVKDKDVLTFVASPDKDDTEKMYPSDLYFIYSAVAELEREREVEMDGR